MKFIIILLFLIGVASNVVDIMNGYNEIIDKSYNKMIYDINDENINCLFKNLPATNINQFNSDQYFNNLTVNKNEIMFGNSEDTKTQFADICLINGQKELWKSNINNTLNNGILWQYSITSNGLFGVYPSYNWELNGKHMKKSDLVTRPWYNVGSTSTKNIIILIDVSNLDEDCETRLEKTLYIVHNFLDSLSFRDYVSIIEYSNSTILYDKKLTQANMINIKKLHAYVNNIKIQENKLSNIGSAIVSAQKIFDNPKYFGFTSGCTNTIIILSSGEDDYISDNAMDVVYSDILVFSFVINFKNKFLSYGNTLSQLSCNSKGIIKIYDEDFNFHDPIVVYNNYLNSGTKHNAVRWSEPYMDNFGMGLIITGSRFVYEKINAVSVFKSIISMDILLSDIVNDEITMEAILSYINNQECEIFNVNEVVYKALQNNSICDNSLKHIVVKDYTEIKLNIIIILVIIILVILLTVFGNNHNIIIFGIIIFIVLLIVNIIFHNQNRITLTVKNVHINPYECCDITNCECSNTNANDCNNLMSNLFEGECNNGLFCCKMMSFECNCVTWNDANGYATTTCGMCHVCDRYIENQKCETVCGTCYNPTVDVYYHINNKKIKTEFTKNCPKDDEECYKDFINSFPKPKKTFIVNLYDITHNINILVFPIGIIILSIFYIILTCYKINNSVTHRYRNMHNQHNYRQYGAMDYN